MLKTISSGQTFIMKVLFPAFWITGFGLGTLGLWLGSMHGANGTPPPEEMKWQFLIMWIVGTMFIRWGCFGLKRVRLDSTNLYVSNYLREISIPITMIVDVTENRWLNIHPVTIHFRYPTDFGESIKFMPKVRFFGWSSHPIVAELKQLASRPVR